MPNVLGMCKGIVTMNMHWGETHSTHLCEKPKTKPEKCANCGGVLAPKDDTHKHTTTNTTDVFDITLLKNIKWSITSEVRHELSSDHLPVIINLKLLKEQRIGEDEITNWSKHKNILAISNSKVATLEEIGNAMIQLEEQILTAISKANYQKIKAAEKQSTESPNVTIKGKEQCKGEILQDSISGR